MIFIVPPGFIMGGTTFAVAMLPTWTYYFSYLFPLTWIFRIFRDVALRAESFYSMSATLGCHLIYVTILAILVTVRFFRTREKMTQEALSLVQQIKQCGKYSCHSMNQGELDRSNEEEHFVKAPPLIFPYRFCIHQLFTYLKNARIFFPFF